MVRLHVFSVGGQGLYYGAFMGVNLISGDEHICDFGIIKPYMLAFRDSQSVCEDGRGMCYKDIGTPEMPNPLCYSPSRKCQASNVPT